MRLSYRRLYCFLLLCLFGTGVLGQTADSLRSRLRALAGKQQAGLLKDTDYLRAVDSIAPFLVQEDSLALWLDRYRDIAFANPRPGRHKAYYYTYLALNAYNTKKLGSAIYYSEKNNEERIDAGLFEKGGLLHSDMFAIVVYYNNHDYVRVASKYQVLAPALKKLAAESPDGEQAFVALSILQVSIYAYCKMGDTVRMQDAYRTARELLTRMREPGVRGGPGGQDALRPQSSFLPQYARYRQQFSYLDHSIDYEERRCTHDSVLAAKLLYASIRDVRDTAFPEGMRADYISGLYTEAVEFYTLEHKKDSVGHYLQLLHGVGANARESTSDSVFLAASDAYLLADEGRFEEAYRQLRNAYQLRDSAFYKVTSDRDNNLYALAEADNARAEMFRSEEKKRRAEQFALYLSFFVSLLVLAGGVLWFVGRSRQRQRLLNLKLGLARNFHDAIGPMLLYANALVKKEMDSHPGERLPELKAHIGKIMDEVRGIAYDLKSNRLWTIDDLAAESAVLLEKLRDAAGIDFSIKTDNGEKLLSHVQYSHLLHIVRELIANSVKHAGCEAIRLELATEGASLQMRYSDDGKGMDPAVTAGGNGFGATGGNGFGAAAGGAGIGLQNIQERIGALNGSFVLDNAWPQGYSVRIAVPLQAGGGRDGHHDMAAGHGATS